MARKKPKKSKRPTVDDINQMWGVSDEIRSDGDVLDEFPGFVKNSVQKDTYPQDTGDVPGTYDIPRTPDVPDTTDVLHTGDVPDTKDVLHTPDVSNTPDVPGTSDVPHTTGVPDTDSVRRPSDVPRKYVRRTSSLDKYQWSIDVYRRCIPDQKSRIKRLLLRGIGKFVPNKRSMLTRRLFSTMVFDELSDLLKGNWKMKRDIPYYRKVWKSLQREGYLSLIDMRLDGPLHERGSIFKVKFPLWVDTNKDVKKVSTRRLILDCILCTEYLKDGDLSVLPYFDMVQKELKKRKIDTEPLCS